MKKTLSYWLFRFLRWLVWLFYPKMDIEGLENLPDEPCIVVGNHSQIHGPIAAEIYFPGKSRTWCAAEMMELKAVPAYAYKDFWAGKPGYIRWFYKLLSYIIAPIAVCVFNNADTIAVYRDARLRNTFRETMEQLDDGANILIFPEHDVPHNHIVHDFQDRFIDLARLYHKKSGKELCFVPLYIAPRLHRMYLGKPTRFNCAADMKEERKRIADYLMDEITATACALPEHTVVPYKNISPKLYPRNTEASIHEKTTC